MTQQKNYASVWDTLEHRRAHIAKDWNYEHGSPAVAIKKKRE
jgi:hypothetical protein